MMEIEFNVLYTELKSLRDKHETERKEILNRYGIKGESTILEYDVLDEEGKREIFLIRDPGDDFFIVPKENNDLYNELTNKIKKRVKIGEISMPNLILCEASIPYIPTELEIKNLILNKIQ